MGGTISLDTAIERWHSREEYSVLLLGTSLQIKRSNGNVRVASRESRDTDIDDQARRAKPDGNIESEAILLDLTNMQENILSADESTYRSRCNIFKVWSQHGRQGKKEMLDVIRDFFQQDCRNFILYYSGHSEEYSGNWAIWTPGAREVETVSLEELLSLWQESPSPKYKRLLIASDSCHSGAWVKKLRMQPNISMVASCKAGETCTETTEGGGDFTRYFLKGKATPPLHFHPTVTEDLKQLGMDSQQ